MECLLRCLLGFMMVIGVYMIFNGYVLWGSFLVAVFFAMYKKPDPEEN